MTVYALFSGQYSDTVFWGVFTTRKAALKFIKDAIGHQEAYDALPPGKGASPYAAPYARLSDARIEECKTDLTWPEMNRLKWAEWLA